MVDRAAASNELHVHSCCVRTFHAAALAKSSLPSCSNGDAGNSWPSRLTRCFRAKPSARTGRPTKRATSFMHSARQRAARRLSASRSLARMYSNWGGSKSNCRKSAGSGGVAWQTRWSKAAALRRAVFLPSSPHAKVPLAQPQFLPLIWRSPSIAELHISRRSGSPCQCHGRALAAR